LGEVVGEQLLDDLPPPCRGKAGVIMAFLPSCRVDRWMRSAREPARVRPDATRWRFVARSAHRPGVVRHTGRVFIGGRGM